jgi:hypothetical protein
MGGHGEEGGFDLGVVVVVGCEVIGGGGPLTVLIFLINGFACKPDEEGR